MTPIFLPSAQPKYDSADQQPRYRDPQLSLFTRHSLNPILSRDNWPYAVNSVFNAGAVRLANGDTLLLCRVEDRR
ncbi:MAG: glycosidase, partial [Acidobacteriaceae bacterium]